MRYSLAGVIVAMVAAGLALALLAWNGGRAEQGELGLGVEFNTHATPVWLSLYDDSFARSGIHVGKILKFRTGLELASALARGDVDVGWACLGPALMIIDKGIPVAIVAKYHNYGYGIAVNPEIVHGLEDLGGRTVYCSGKGSPTYLLLLRVSENYNISYGSIKFMPPEQSLSALLSGRIAAAALPEHYLSVAESKGMRVILRAQDVWPNMPGSFIVVRKSLLSSEKGLVRKIVALTFEKVSEITDGSREAVEADMVFLGIGEDVARMSIGDLEWNTTIDVNAVQEYIDYMYNHGLLRHRLNASEIIVSLG